MEAALVGDVRELCKAISTEQNPNRMKVLLDQLLRVLDEREERAALL